MRYLVAMLAMGTLCLGGCKKSVDLGLSLGEQVTVLELEWAPDEKGERGKLGVPVRLSNPTEEPVHVSKLSLAISSGGKSQCNESKDLDRTIEAGGQIKMRLDIVCHWEDLAAGFSADGAITVDSDGGEPFELAISEASLRVHK
jgi:hypothetical protein